MMTDSSLQWLLFNLLSLIFLAFYSMIEMACVSFNKVRLHYYVYKGNQRAIWLNNLLQHPFRLFGTTLVGVNVAMVIGSECARQFHQSIGLSPDLAPLSQVIFVVILGELAPMFAARHYAEHVAMLGAPLLYFSSKLLTPVLGLIGGVSHFANLLIQGKTKETSPFLNQEELQKILEEHGEESPRSESETFNLITENIFRLRHQDAGTISAPLENFPRLPSNATVLQMKNGIRKTKSDFALIYYNDFSNIVGIAFPRDLVKLSDHKRVRDLARPPWFVTESSRLTEILQQFQRNNQTVAVILDSQGKAKGVVTLEDLLDEVLGEGEEVQPGFSKKRSIVLERTLPGSMTVKEFKEQFKISLDSEETLTLSDLMEKLLGHLPESGESAYTESIELEAKEISLLEVKNVLVRTRSSTFR